MSKLTTTQLAKTLHDLAGSLSVIMLCVPELKKHHIVQSSESTDELFALCESAMCEARKQIHTAQETLHKQTTPPQ